MIRHSLTRKAGVFWFLLRSGRLSLIAQAATAKIVRVHTYRLDRLDLRARESVPTKQSWLACRFATADDLERLFAEWRDDAEERERHRRVYQDLGFRDCFFGLDRVLGKVAHFQFLLTHDDRQRIERHMPRFMRHYSAEPSAAWQEWVYTFSDYRRRGVSVLATEELLGHCRRRGITTLYSHRGATNVASLRMAEAIGYQAVARVFHCQFFGQTREQGVYLVRPMPSR